jgi:glycosyltransferase involved in cell wall biosynthesis
VRILWLTPELPFAPGGSGGATRQFHLVRRLVEQGHDVAVVAPVHRSQHEGAARLQASGATLHAVSRPDSRWRETLAALGTRPRLVPGALRQPVLAWQVDVFWTRLRAAALEAIGARAPDVLQVEHDWAAAWQNGLAPGVPRALTLHNLSWGYYEARARAAGGVRGAALALEAQRFRRYDRARLDAYDLLLAMSEGDRRGVAALAAGRCEVVPNGVDGAAWTPPPEPATAEREPLLLFTGSLSYPPNVEAVAWLLRDLWPRIREATPGARLAIVGANPPEIARDFDDPRVVVTGWVDDVRPWFARASVVLVPLRSGGGTRLKVLDGLASRRAIVSTTIGAEGIDARDGEHLLIADGADAFTDAVARALADTSLRHRLGAAGRRLVEERYDWDVLASRLEALYRELVSSSALAAQPANARS